MSAGVAAGPDMDAYVYILGAFSKKRYLTYVGWTNDVAKRLARHNAGKGARSTRGRVWVLLHSERFATRREAMSREWHLKRDRAFRKMLAMAFSAGSLNYRASSTRTLRATGPVSPMAST